MSTMSDYQRIARAVAAVAAGHHLPDDDSIPDISRTLSSRAAHHLATTCPLWRAILSKPEFLSHHLAPRPLAADEFPRAFIVQPRKHGFTHLTLIPIDPAAVDVPVRNKYTRPSPPPSNYLRQHDSKDAEHPPLPEMEPDRFALDDPSAPEGEVVDDHATFFARTVPALDLCIVAAHGRLLLCRGRRCYYVCDPANNRWVELPPEHDVNSGLHYDDAALTVTGRVDFTVVLIGCKHRRVIVETFTSSIGRWETKEQPVHGTRRLTRCVGPASPGIHVGGCFYWLSRQRGRILRYDVAAGGRVSVVREPAEPEGSIGRLGRSLGSTGGRLRMCAYDICDERKRCMLPHGGGEGVHGVWVMSSTTDGSWRRVHEAWVGDIDFWYFHTLFESDTPVDFAGACGDFVVMTDGGLRFWRYDYLESDGVQLSGIDYHDIDVDNPIELYRRNVFSELTMPGYQRIARAVATAAARHLPDDGVISDISRNLTSRAVHRLAAACPRWRAIVSQPPFLRCHLAPRPIAADEFPRALIIQPRKLGFTHLTFIPIDPTAADPLAAVNVPVRNKYTRPPPPPSHYQRQFELERRREDPSASVTEELPPPLPETEPDRFDLDDPSSPEWEVVDDHAAFFARTVPALDLCIVAAHGRLLLCRGRRCYYVCDPANNRWVALPPSTLPPQPDVSSGLHYDVDDAGIHFTVVLIGCRRRRVIVETFTSSTGKWETKVLPNQGTQGLTRCVGPASPGIHAGGYFYWLTHRRGRILRYDVAGDGHVAIVREPAESEGSIGRAGRSLGSTGGQLRMCAYDIRDEQRDCVDPHEGGEGVHGVWVMTPAAAAEADGAWAWRRVHEARVEGVDFYYFHMLFDRETPVDFAGARGDFVVMTDGGRRFWRYDYLESKVKLAHLYDYNDGIGVHNRVELYHRNVFRQLSRRYHVFPFFG
uniref:F-box domain-containing protein n=1 Tax=Leersia perrieri TaxID=77586 RepID=A0A0D9X7P7_9ORYZ